MKKCVHCGSPRVNGATEKYRVLIGREKHVTKVQADRCDDCGVSTMSGDTVQAAELEIAAKLVSQPNMSGPEHRYCRHVAGLPIERAARAYNTDRENLKAIETDERRVPKRYRVFIAKLVKQALRRQERTAR